MTVAMALVVGCFIAVAGVVLGTILDRTIRFPGDVKDRLDTRVLAVVPRTRLTAAMRKRLETPDEHTPAVVPVPSELVEVAAMNDVELDVSTPDEPVSAGTVDENGTQESPPADGGQGSPLPTVDTLASVTLKRVP
jgi:hypothetical protein